MDERKLESMDGKMAKEVTTDYEAIRWHAGYSVQPKNIWRRRYKKHKQNQVQRKGMVENQRSDIEAIDGVQDESTNQYTFAQPSILNVRGEVLVSIPSSLSLTSMYVLCGVRTSVILCAGNRACEKVE